MGSEFWADLAAGVSELIAGMFVLFGVAILLLPFIFALAALIAFLFDLFEELFGEWF